METTLITVICTLVLRINAQYDYGEVLEKSIMFYEAQRSGDLDEATNRIPWRGDSALDDSGGTNDLTGGWYDGEGTVKYGFPMAWTTTVLAWSIVEFQAGYENAGQLKNALNGIRWPLDYFIKGHYGPTDLNAQCGDASIDQSWYTRPENMTLARPCYSLHSGTPGSDLASETAAAMAAGSLAFQQSDPTYAATLLQHAKDIYDFAYNERGFYHDHVPTEDYRSSGYTDELCWGALWLHRATGEQQYMDMGLEFYDSGVPWAFSWDAKGPGNQLLMYLLTGDPQYAGHVENYLVSWMPGGGVVYTPLGLAWRDTWGTLRYTANTAFIALLADTYGIMPGEARTWAKNQINYILGDTGRSFVVGFGTNPPVEPIHRGAGCDPDHSVPCSGSPASGPNPNVLYGALVGGPDAQDYYEDSRNSYVFNVIACDYNAGFQGSIAALN